ncbi:MAG TPA: hypothetical protein VNT60_09340, partial [Deinococcales bacterium]|nr:hypothetical protein [Deinococcales bacterium]
MSETLPAAAPTAPFTVRAYESNDADGLLALFEAASGRPADRAEFDEWEARREPAHFHCRLVAERGGTLVGAAEAQQSGFSLPGMLEWEAAWLPDTEEAVRDALVRAVGERVAAAGAFT